MRILIIVDCYFPTTKSSAKLVHDLGAEFVARGQEVIVLTPSETIKEPIEISLEDGIRIARVRTGKIKGAGLVQRAWQEVRLSRTLWAGAQDFLRANPCDLIVFYSPSIFFGALVAKLKRLWNSRSYLILRDIFPQWAVDAGVMRKGLVFQYFRHRELQQYAAADVIGVQTAGNLEYFAKQLPQENYKLEVLLNWTPLSEPVPEGAGYRQRLGLAGRVVFFFGGNIGVAQDMDNILRLAEAMRDHEDAYFLIVGEGSEVVRLKKAIVDKGLPNMVILPAVGQSEYLAMLAECDIGLISLDKRLSTQNVPGKLMGYMQFSKPVLASLNAGNDLKEILDEAGAGFCVVNGDDAGMLSAALRLANEPELRARLGKNSHRLLEERFSVAKAADQILRHLNPSGASSNG